MLYPSFECHGKERKERRHSMRRVIMAGALVLAVLVPAGWATAVTLPGPTGTKAPNLRPRASVGKTHKAVHVRGTTVKAGTKRARGGTRTNRLASGKARAPAGRGHVRVHNAKLGGLNLGLRQRPNDHNRIRVRGNAGGTPVRTGLRL
jgi:hypothetical protein